MKKVIVLFLLAQAGMAQWKNLDTGTSASFRSMAVVNKKVIWAGGTASTVIKSTDGGNSWLVKKVTDTPLDFRGMAAFDKKVAVAVSAGLGENGAARIFRTNDGGLSWSQVFETTEKGVFLDGVCFLTKRHGFVFGDALGQEVYLLETHDGGRTWARVPPQSLPQVSAGSASFAASNSGMTHKKDEVWYAFQSEILYSADAGKTWELRESGFPSGESNGIFGLHFTDNSNGFILGGDYLKDREVQVNLAVTDDGGLTWQQQKTEPHGLKESAASARDLIVVTGTSGTSLSRDGGISWEIFDKQAFHVVRCAGRHCFVAGAGGQMGYAQFK